MSYYCVVQGCQNLKDKNLDRYSIDIVRQTSHNLELLRNFDQTAYQIWEMTESDDAEFGYQFLKEILPVSA